MIKLILIILVSTPSIFARQLNIKFVAPTEREDNTPLKPEEIKQFNMYYGTKAGDYQNDLVIDGAARDVIVSNLPDSDLYLVLTTVDTDGRESVYSTEVFSEFDIERPDAPGTIEIEL